MHEQLKEYIGQHPAAVNKVIEFNPAIDRFFKFNLTEANKALLNVDVTNTQNFAQYINTTMHANNCRFGIGGYMEYRDIYRRSNLFNTLDEPRRLHLGVDIWGLANTAVYAPLAGTVHSFKDNNHFGDYGPTIILQHNLNGLRLYTLYGHLSRKSLDNLRVGDAIQSGQKIAVLGHQEENGSWPPHLHFQLMYNLENHTGDYPGVGKLSEKDILIANIPNPQIILQIPAATIVC